MRTIDKRLSALESTRYANAHAGAFVVDIGGTLDENANA